MIKDVVQAIEVISGNNLSFLSQVFSLLALILTVSPGFKVSSQFWVSGLIAVLMVEGLGRSLTEGILVRIG